MASATLKRALSVAEAMAPCVLLFDEIEKMFGGESQQQGRHEETGRMLGTLLTHMEECTLPIVRVATCNHHNLPPELLQRFEKLFFVDLPNRVECEEIFRIHITAVKRNPDYYDIKALAQAASTKGFVGREIRNIVIESLTDAFYDGSNLSTETMMHYIQKNTPMSASKEGDLKEIRGWAKVNATPASTPIEKEIGIIEGS